jgi:SP family arabinose:H+ symporter-like MFS transporter
MIFQKAGFTRPSDAILLTLMMNLTSLVCTVATLLLVDRVGRRPLLLIGMAGMAVGQGLLGLSLNSGSAGIPTVASLLFSNVFYQISIAPLAWMILSEVFPTRARAKGQAVGTFAVWISTYASNQFLGPLMSYFEHRFGSAAGAFWLYATVCVFTFGFSRKLVPETKGRTLEEIARFWAPRNLRRVG